MKTNPYSYEADWRKYAYPPQATRFANEEDLSEKFTPVTL